MDIEEVGQEDEGEDRQEIQLQEIAAGPAPPVPMLREQVTEPIMGKRGEIWCNIDEKNLVTGPRRRK